MLEVKNLTKIYRPKKGVPVKALDNVSIKFPEKGMVFLLGKSGSGKSTLLNLLGGLDRYDGGELIINGVSSKSFGQKHFDSYRNTYVGFIFQEYNVLDEFSVGANIGLAIELQGRKANEKDINDILDRVDLAGYGSRKPNELSGGQKQRVAIARALVKNPRIIMADEPTGALDSVTGRQVLDTLKKLSSDKLVIVVSHDRDFAERYADRIIELSDGHVSSDMEYLSDSVPEEAAGLSFDGNTVTVPAKYRLTQDDLEKINAYIQALETEASISLPAASRTSRRATATDESRIVPAKAGDFKLIRSRLPMRFAYRIGVSSLKFKKVRLAFTILLSCVAFVLFGLADTFGSYDYVSTCTDSIVDSQIGYASVEKSVKQYYGADKDFFYFVPQLLSEDDLDDLFRETGIRFNGVWSPLAGYGYYQGDLSFDDYIGQKYSDNPAGVSYDSVYSTSFSGYAAVDAGVLEDAGMSLTAGRLPEGDADEIAISLYLAQTFINYGYADADPYLSGNADGVPKPEAVSSPEELIGRTVFGHKIVGIVDTHVDIDRYAPAYETDPGDTAADLLLKYALQNEFSYIKSYSFSRVIMVSGDYMKALTSDTAVLNCEVSGLNADGYIMYGYLGSAGRISELDPEKLIFPDGEAADFTRFEAVLPLSVAYDIAFSGSVSELSPDDVDSILSLLKDVEFEFSAGNTEYRFTVAALYDDRDEISPKSVFFSDGDADAMFSSISAKYSFAAASMPESERDIRNLVRFTGEEYGDTGTKYSLCNPVAYELELLDSLFTTLSTVFLYIGIGFAVFASLLLSNFISASITHKKREIGILRAIGSRGNDVFRIFFSESFTIAMINFVLTVLGLFLITEWINGVIRNGAGLLITVLGFGLRQILLVLAISILVAAVASFIPVKRIASKKPIDAIRDR